MFAVSVSSDGVRNSCTDRRRARVIFSAVEPREVLRATPFCRAPDGQTDRQTWLRIEPPVESGAHLKLGGGMRISRRI